MTTEKPGLLKILLIFIMVLLTVAVNMDDNIIARLGFEHNYLMAALAAVIITGLTVYRNLLLVVLVLGLSIAANMPESFMLNFGIDRDILTGFLGAIVVLPVLVRLFDL